MAQFFFDIIDGPLTSIDTQGSEFEDIELVREEAIGFLLERANNRSADALSYPVECVVRRDAGDVMLKVTLSVTAETFE